MVFPIVDQGAARAVCAQDNLSDGKHFPHEFVWSDVTRVGMGEDDGIGLDSEPAEGFSEGLVEAEFSTGIDQHRIPIRAGEAGGVGAVVQIIDDDRVLIRSLGGSPCTGDFGESSCGPCAGVGDDGVVAIEKLGSGGPNRIDQSGKQGDKEQDENLNYEKHCSKNGDRRDHPEVKHRKRCGTGGSR